jgi:hypothetical protein
LHRSKDEQPTAHTYDAIADSRSVKGNKDVDQLYCEIATPSTEAGKGEEGFSMSDCAAYGPTSVPVTNKEEDGVNQTGLYETVESV